MTNKYHNRKVKTSEGIAHASRKEAVRWIKLNRLKEKGLISDLQRQVKFLLIPKQDGERACEYVADFVYKDAAGNLVVEDAKGYKKGTVYDLFVIKRKLMLYVHGIRVKEV